MAQELAAEFGTPYYTRIDAEATPEQKARLQRLAPEAVREGELAGEPIVAKLTRAPGNNAPIDPLRFEELVANKLRDAKAKKSASEVVFVVTLEDGEVRLKTRIAK